MKRFALVLAPLVLATSSLAQEEAPAKAGTPSNSSTDDARKPGESETSKASPEPAKGAEGRTAEAILADLKAAEVPALDPAKRDDQAAVLEYFQKRAEISRRRMALIKELFRADPANDQLPKLMYERWTALASRMRGLPVPELDDEIEGILSGSRNEKLKVEALYMRAMLAVRSQTTDLATKLKAIDGFNDRAHDDPRGAILLIMAAGSGSAKEQSDLYKKFLEKYPDHQYTPMVRGNLKRLEGVGKPFELEFTDAIKGKSVAMKDLRGKVVVVDFWATWCGPCVAEMPKMKDLYARYREKGVEFIGVSLDQPEDEGGLEKLKTFVAKNEIAWPQYYAGKGWESEFTRSWGINSIPCVFVVDQKGTLHSVEARGKLEEMIPELLGETKPEASPPRTEATPAKDVSGFNRWDYGKDDDGKKGYFEKEEGGRWVECKDGQVFARFEEVKRTSTFIEIKDPSRSMSLRLYASKILWKTADQDEWNLLPFSAEGKAR